MAEGKRKSERFKYTRELLQIALQEMTQIEIAKLCRTTQSAVSEWSSGKSKAPIHVLRPLQQRYGNRLNRTTARVYLAESPAPDAPRWEDSENGRQFADLHARNIEWEHRLADLHARDIEWERNSGRARISRRAMEERRVTEEEGKAMEEERRAIEEERKAIEEERRAMEKDLVKQIFGKPEAVDFTTAIKVSKEEFEARVRPLRIVRVDGPIVLRYSFRRLMTLPRGPRLELEPVPVARWFIHHQQRGQFVLVRQRRRELTGLAWLRWKQMMDEAHEAAKKHQHRGSTEAGTEVSRIILFAEHAHPFVDCADDAGRWISTIEGPLDMDRLLERADQLLADPAELHGPHDEITLPFLLRKMLVDEGYSVTGVEHIPDFGYGSIQAPTTQEEPHSKALPPDTREPSA